MDNSIEKLEEIDLEHSPPREQTQNLMASYDNLGHVHTNLPFVELSKGLPTESARLSYRALPRSMIYNANRNAVNRSNEKSLADVDSENWKFYEPESAFGHKSARDLSQKTAILKAIMLERNKSILPQRVSAFEKLPMTNNPMKRKRK